MSLAFISGEGSLKPPSSVLTMLGGREPRPTAGMFRQMLDTLVVRFVDDVFTVEEQSNSEPPHSVLGLDDRPKNMRFFFNNLN